MRYFLLIVVLMACSVNRSYAAAADRLGETSTDTDFGANALDVYEKRIEKGKDLKVRGDGECITPLRLNGHYSFIVRDAAKDMLYEVALSGSEGSCSWEVSYPNAKVKETKDNASKNQEFRETAKIIYDLELQVNFETKTFSDVSAHDRSKEIYYSLVFMNKETKQIKSVYKYKSTIAMKKEAAKSGMHTRFQGDTVKLQEEFLYQDVGNYVLLLVLDESML